MIIYIATSSDFGHFGCYSSILRARKAIEYWLSKATDVASFEDIGNYTYQYHTTKGEDFSITISHDIVDIEFENGEIIDELP